MRWAGRAVAAGLTLTLGALAGCATRPRPIVSDNRYAPPSDGTNARAVRGDVVTDAQLVPEPGDIWADIVPGRRLAGPTVAAGAPPPQANRSAAVPSAGAGRGQTAATMIAPQTNADTVEWPASPPQRTRSGAGSTAKTAPATANAPALATEPAPDSRASAPAVVTPAERATTSATAGLATPGQGEPSSSAAHVPAPGDATMADGIRVQLMAAGSEAEARAGWARLDRHAPDLLRGRSPQLVLADANGRTVWRLRTGGFANRTEAAGFCARARDAGAQCWVVGSGA